MTNVTAPSEPPMTGWIFPDPMEADEDIVAVGADLEPGTVLAAYRLGLFPMPMTEVEGMSWWSPVRRGILPIEGLRVTRSMRQSAKHFDVTVDSAVRRGRGAAARTRIGRAVGSTGTSPRPTPSCYELGWAHSVEVWREGELVGGLYGVAIGGLFAGESMFYVERDASKVALMHLVELLDDGDRRRLIDVQWSTPHLMTLGVIEVPRWEYLALLRDALGVPLPAVWNASSATA